MGDHSMEDVRTVKTKYEDTLLMLPGVIGVGVGMRQRGGQWTDEVCIVVSVQNKLPADVLDPKEIIPHELEGVPVDVLEVGEISLG